MTDDSLRGLALSRAFCDEAVRPVIDSRFPDLQYAAALLGPVPKCLVLTMQCPPTTTGGHGCTCFERR